MARPQGLSFDFGPPEPAEWTRIARGFGRADYLHRTGARVVWCGHPTALRPYYVRLPDGCPLDIYGNGSGPGFTTFRTVAEAKLAAVRLTPVDGR